MFWANKCSLGEHKTFLSKAVICWNSPKQTYRFPLQRNVTRANKHGIKVVVKNEDGPVNEHDEVDAASCGVQWPVPDYGV